jgi:hypothetical protein
MVASEHRKNTSEVNSLVASQQDYNDEAEEIVKYYLPGRVFYQYNIALFLLISSFGSGRGHSVLKSGALKNQFME